MIFKQMTFAKRKFGDKYDAEEEEDPLGNRPEQNVAAVRSEREVQSKINLVCESPHTQSVHFYLEKENDKSLICMLREIAFRSVTKCKNSDCQQFQLHHQHHFYHKDGYVEMKMRFS